MHQKACVREQQQQQEALLHEATMDSGTSIINYIFVLQI
jgi:hypothetical protein